MGPTEEKIRELISGRYYKDPVYDLILILAQEVDRLRDKTQDQFREHFHPKERDL